MKKFNFYFLKNIYIIVQIRIVLGSHNRIQYVIVPYTMHFLWIPNLKVNAK